MRILVGVPIMPCNDSHDIVVFYQYKIKDYIFRLKSTNLSPQDVFFGYEIFWFPSIAFVAPVITIPHGGSILAPLHKALLLKFKIMHIFPLVMRSTPSELGGLNLRYLEITTGVQAIYHLVSLFTSNTPSKLLLITAIEYHQLEVGVEQLFLFTSYAKLSKLATSTWVTHLWEFLHLHRLELCLPTLDLPSSPGNNDATITDLLLTFDWKDEKLRLVNQVRLYLKVYLVSDLLLPRNNKIKRCFVQGEKDEATFSEYAWPIVQPNKVSFSAWKQGISDISNIDGTLQQSVRWKNMQNSHRKTNSSVNADHTVICIKTSTREIRHYTADISRSSHRYKRCSISNNFVPSEEIHVYATLTDCIWTVFRRCTLHQLTILCSILNQSAVQ